MTPNQGGGTEWDGPTDLEALGLLVAIKNSDKLYGLESRGLYVSSCIITRFADSPQTLKTAVGSEAIELT